jgi:predicted PurR-regulated permease PerM
VTSGERLSSVFWRSFASAWGVLLAAALGYGIWRLREVAMMFIISGMLAYLLAAPTDWLTRRMPRPAAVGIVFVLFVLALLGIFGSFLPVIYAQGSSFAEHLPSMLREIGMFVENMSNKTILGYRVDISLDKAVENILSQIQTSGPVILNRVLSHTQSILSGTAALMAGLVFVPMITLYLMLDSARLRRALVLCFPQGHRNEVDTALSSVSLSIAGYIRSRVLLALFVFVTYSILFTVLGIPFGILLSVLAFISEFIPVVGWWIAFVPIVLLSLLHDNPLVVIPVIIGISVLQLIQNFAVAPKLLSDTMEIHPLTVVLAMMMGGALGGGMGLLLAVPVAAAAKAILTQFFWKGNASAEE